MKIGNKFFRSLTVLIFFMMVFVLEANSVLAASINLSGSVSTSNTAFTDCSTNYGKILPFTVDTTGTYTLNNPSPTAVFNGPTFFYVGVFSVIPSYVLAHPNRLFLINNSLVLTASASLNAGTTYYLVIGGSAGCGTSYPVNYNFTFSGVGNIIFPSSPAPVVNTAIPVQRYFTDGRLNRYDEAAPIAVYPIAVNEEFGLAIYDTYAQNSLLLFVSPAEIALTDAVTENTLIAAAASGRASVYRLADGTFQINAVMSNGKLYVLNFAEILPNATYSSAEMD